MGKHMITTEEAQSILNQRLTPNCLQNDASCEQCIKIRMKQISIRNELSSCNQVSRYVTKNSLCSKIDLTPALILKQHNLKLSLLLTH
jgi:hypothetical protein